MKPLAAFALVLGLAAGAILSSAARAQDPGGADKPAGATARLTIASEPADAVVSILRRTPGETAPAPVGRRVRLEDRIERVLGRTPVASVDVPAGLAEVVVAKEGYVLKVEPVELQAGTAQRLEVRLTKDVAIPCGISFKDTDALAKTPAEAMGLVDMVLRSVVALFVEEKDPRALVDASVKALVDALSAVRLREGLLRRELGDAGRQRFYGDEVDLRSYPELSYRETDEGSGRRRWTLAAGTQAVEGVTSSDDFETYRRKLHAVFVFVKNRWDRDARLDDSMLARACIDGLLGALDDQHTHFLTPTAWKEMGEDTSGKFVGIGIVVGLREGHVTVIAPMEGTPGEKAGLLAGDRILAIDGHVTEGMLLSEAVKLMRGEPDSTIAIRVQRGAGAPFELSVKRALVSVRSTKALMLDGGIGYLRITTFMNEKLDEEVAAALDELEAKGMKALVFDLRNNPGGLLVKAKEIAQMFVPEKEVVVSTRGRAPQTSNVLFAEKPRKARRYPIAVLVNGGSASASEILAGTLREHGLAVLVGEKTFGKGSVQKVIPLDPYGCALALTIATYHLPSGFTPHKKGIVPDVAVTLTDDEKVELAARSVYTSVNDARDRQLSAAVAELVKALAVPAAVPEKK
jgi:carboxyl-terminal processing protease